MRQAWGLDSGNDGVTWTWMCVFLGAEPRLRCDLLSISDYGCTSICRCCRGVHVCVLPPPLVLDRALKPEGLRQVAIRRTSNEAFIRSNQGHLLIGDAGCALLGGQSAGLTRCGRRAATVVDMGWLRLFFQG